MGAPEGNQFWKLRSKHGRDKIFESPELLWEVACEYFEWCESNPLLESKPMVVSIGNNQGSSVEMTEIPKMRAFTWSGLELYIDIHRLRDYKTNEKYKDFSPVIEQIEKVIYDQKFTGAAAGFLNPNIIARDLGLVDKIDQKTEHSGSVTTYTGIEMVEPNAPKEV
jgi:hypothetical protein